MVQCTNDCAFTSSFFWQRLPPSWKQHLGRNSTTIQQTLITPEPPQTLIIRQASTSTPTTTPIPTPITNAGLLDHLFSTASRTSNFHLTLCVSSTISSASKWRNQSSPSW